MATSSAGEEESITVLHESSGPSENNTLTEPVSRVRDKHNSRQWRRCKFLVKLVPAVSHSSSSGHFSYVFLSFSTVKFLFHP